MLVSRTRGSPGGSIVAWDVDNAAGLAAITGLVAEDVGRVARAADTGLLYVLQTHSPAVWSGALGAAAATILTIETITGTTYTLVLGDANKLKQTTNGSAVTVTVPPNASVAFPIGTQVHFEQNGAGALTLAPGSGVTLEPSTLTARARYSALTATKTATNRWLVTGDMAV
jgi:hypothetical protein